MHLFSAAGCPFLRALDDHFPHASVSSILSSGGGSASKSCGSLSLGDTELQALGLESREETLGFGQK